MEKMKDTVVKMAKEVVGREKGRRGRRRNTVVERGNPANIKEKGRCF